MSNYSPTLTDKISSIIQTQFPEFIQSDHNTFIQFLKYYYEFLESGELVLTGSNDYIVEETQTVNYILSSDNEKIVLEESVGKYTVGEIIIGQNSKATAKVLVDNFDVDNRLFITSQQLFEIGETVIGQSSGAYSTIVSYRANPVQNIQQFLEYGDLDYTIYEFLDKFRNSFMESIPNSLASNVSKRNLLKNIKELYSAKGTEDGHKLFFRLLLNQEPEIIYPRDNILRASDGVWSTDKIMRVVENGTSDFNNLIGQTIYTKDATETIIARAIVATVVKYREGSTLIAELNLDSNSISGTFNSGDIVYGVDTILDFEISAIVKNIVTNASIINSGFYYNAGDLIDVELIGSRTAAAKIDTVGSGSIDEIMIDNPGSGYSLNDQIIFDNTNTEGKEGSAIVTVVGGSFSLESFTSPDHLITEDEDYIISEDGFYLQFEQDIGEVVLLTTEDEDYIISEDNVNFRLEQDLVEDNFLLLENEDNIIVEEETFNVLGVTPEIGEIRKIKIINEGSGYIKLPSLTISSSTGSGASIYALSTKSPGVGHAQGIAITNFGLEYNSIPKFILNRNVIVKNITGSFSAGDRLSSHNAVVVDFVSANNLLELRTEAIFSKGDIIVAETGSTATVHFSNPATAVSQIGTIGTTVGNFVNERGKISNNTMRIQDSFYYQDYSYVVKVGESINQWRDSVKQSIHPSGWNLFGEVSFSTLLPAKVAIPTYSAGTQQITIPSTFSSIIFTVVFGRRLGTTTDTTLSTNPNNVYDISSELIDGERDVTLKQDTVVSLSVSRGSHYRGPLLADLPKYAFAIPPITQSGYPQYYPNPAGVRLTNFNDITRGLYSIEQFSKYTIKQVSDYCYIILSSGIDAGYKIQLENEEGYILEEQLSIPSAAYVTRTNVPPPSQITLVDILSMSSTNITVDDTDTTFDFVI